MKKIKCLVILALVCFFALNMSAQTPADVQKANEAKIKSDEDVVKKALETVLMIDPDFQQGSADRALGRWYQKVPGLFGGSNDKSVEHLKRSLTHDPASTASHFFLAETYLEMNRRDQARQEAQKVLELPVNPNWAPEDREFKQKATALLDRLR